MPGQWRVLSQFLGDRRVYIAGRQINLTQPLHGGNVEFFGMYSDNHDRAEQTVAELNARGDAE